MTGAFTFEEAATPSAPTPTPPPVQPGTSFSFEDAQPEGAFSFEEALPPTAFSFEDAATPKPGIGGSFVGGVRSGFRALGEQASTLAGLATGKPGVAIPPDAFDAKYAETPFFQKLTDPNWLAHFIPQTVVGSAPFLAGAGAGAAAGAPLGPLGSLIGAMIGGGTAGGLQSLADAYQEALRANQPDDAAIDYAMKQGAANAGLSAATIPLGLWGVAKGPISYVLKQMVAQPAGAAATQGASNVIAKAEGIDPNRELTAGMPEAAFGAGLFQGPVTAKALRSAHQARQRVGEEPQVQPGAEGPEPGTRYVLGLEEQVSDPATGKVTKAVAPADVTVQGYDPETGLVAVTRDSDGAQLGPMSVDDFMALRRPEEPGPLPEPVAERAATPTTEDVAARDEALDVARDRGFAEPLEGGQMPRPIPEEVPETGELPVAPGLPEERGKRPFMTREPRETTPDLPGLDEAEQRMAYEMDVAEEADRRAPDKFGKAPPQDLISFLAESGGMRDEGGELASMGLDRQHRPGVKKLVQEGGAWQDRALERAIEGGFLPEDASVRDLLDAIDDTARGRPIYSQMDMADVNLRREATEAKAAASEALRERAAELGIDTRAHDDRELRRMVREAEREAERQDRIEAEMLAADEAPRAFRSFSDADLRGMAEKNVGDARAAIEEELSRRGVPREPEPKIRVYHGSPHHIDAFADNKIGTGEGAQSYGYGHYFAESERVGRFYQEKLGANRWEAMREVLPEYFKPGSVVPSYGGYDKVLEYVPGRDGAWDFSVKVIASDEDGNPVYGARPRVHSTVPDLRQIEEVLGRRPGNLYEVEIAGHPDAFLDWDKPINQQSPQVLAALEKSRLVFHEDDLKQPFGEWYKTLTDPRHGSMDSAWLSGELQKAGISGIRYLDGDSRVAGEGTRNYVVFDPKTTEIVAKNGKILKTPEGAYAAASKDGELLGAYSSKKKAEEALNDKAATNDAVDGMTLRHTAEQERAAKTAADEHKGKGPPKGIDKATELLPDPPRERVRMKDLGAAEAKGIFPRTLAMQDRPFARLYKPVQKREEHQTRNYRDFFWQVKPLGALTKPSRDQVFKAATIARLSNRNIVPTGARLVIKNGDKAVIDPDTGKTWLAPGETVKLTKEETEAYFAMKSAFQTVWRRHTDAVVRNLGYDGDLEALRRAAASKSEAERTAFIEASKKPETARRALDVTSGLLAQEKTGYIPFQRRGDVMITVMPKAEKGLKTSAGELGGKAEPLESVFVDSGTLRKSMFGRKFEQGDYGPKVAAKVKELRQRHKDKGVVLEPRYISEMRPDELPLNALERLVSGVANENTDIREALMNGFMKDVYKSAQSGFRKASDDLAGFSTDFDRMVTEYLHHTARVLPMIEHRNEIDAAKTRLMGGHDAKGKAIPPEGSPSVSRYARKWLDSVNDPGGDFAGLRKAGFLWWLWASPSSAIINLTQTPLVTIPVLGKWGGNARAILETNKLAAQILRPDKMMFGKKNWGTDGGKIVLNIDNVHVSEKEKALLREWERDGSLQAQVTSDMLGNNIGKSPAFRPMAKMAQKAYEAGASLFGAAEVTNRAIAGLAAYRLALQPGALEKARKVYKDNQLFREQFGDKVTPENLGKWAILETQFQGGKINTPEIMRGIGAPLTQFKKFTGNYLSLLNRQFRHEGAAGKVASSMMLASLVAAAGVKGLPFAQDLADAADWATEFATGVNPHLEMTIRNWLRDGLEGVGGKHWGDIMSEVLMNGPSRYLTGMDAGQRMGQGKLTPSNPMDMFGPLAGAIAQGADAAKLYGHGQNYQATSKLLPKGLGNIASAVGLQEEGTTTAAGNEVMDASEFSNADVAKRALGFQPADLARRYENIFDLSKVDADARRASSGFYRRLGRALKQAESFKAQGDMQRAEQFMNRFQADLDRYQKNIEDPRRPEWMKFKINRESLKREIANAMDWSRRFTKGSPKQARPEIMRMMERMSKSVGESTSLEGEDE